ncbi:ferredoxin--NADP reductase [Acidobacterium sp. S8]|uniref:ferredoxin--NADP reductase n=1 Tax=Acidobacterium sp. S8 TaxID=1641854 RepID=UPI00131CE8F7|nr:FAD-dependent oxidoreductase [Acidobacterium sp. S8]
MDRPLFTARLQQKLMLSAPAECYHLEFSIDELSHFDFAPGQFVSCVAVDERGKSQTRAYSVASAPRANQFDLCVNRVEGGFFSNLLCDLEPGQTIPFHGPHGLFTLRQPLTDAIFIATGTGIAPLRGFVEWLFPESGDDRSQGRTIWLVYGTRHETEIYYQKYFQKVAAERHNFHYLSTLSRPHEGWEGLRGYVQQHVGEIVTARANQNHSAPVITVAEPAGFDVHAYICGLNDMVSANRSKLTELGWQRKQIIFERYD